MPAPMLPTESVRTSFVERFGEDQARALVAAATEHMNGVHDNRGSDPFKWALLICIGYQCFEIDGYRTHHGITADYDLIKAWAAESADLASHDGDVDYLAMMAGTYEAWIPASAS